MLRVGLTGGIGCGKSTVAAMMRELGCHVISADQIAHALMLPGQPAYSEIRRQFGAQVVASDGNIDRARLAGIVFADPQRLASLNAIVHPGVLSELDQEFDRLSQIDPQGIAVVEAALLIESGYHRQLDRLVLVDCTPVQQLERLTDPVFGRNMSLDQARKRIAAQMTVEEKRQLANDEIDSSVSLDDTKKQVRTLVDRLRRLAESSRR
jgi:dephospho-CoA kinase